MKKLLVSILAGAIPGAVILLLAIIIVLRCRRRKKLPSNTTTPFTETAAKSIDSFPSSLHKLHLSHKSSASKSSLRFHHLHNQQQPILQQWLPFNWDEHPQFVDEAGEHGWARFTFTTHPAVSGAKTSTPLLGLCAACDFGGQQDLADIEWELPRGDPELMQTIRLKPGSKKGNSDESFSSIRMSLPLPGPRFGGSSFPQEAYFEITIMFLQPQQPRSSKHNGRGSGDRSKLSRENSTAALVHSPLQDDKSALEEEGKQADCTISVGLAVGESASNRSMPGTYPGSIGFCSNGSVHLDGMKLVFESERGEWAGVNRVIGCGFNPSKKKVFLMVDSVLVHAISCNSDVYRSPLYPVVAVAKADLMVLVNLGQRAFKYAPANASRTANPCFTRTPSHDADAGFVHSRELFLMGGIDQEECFDITRATSSRKGDDSRVDIDADSELFEISLNR